MEMSSSKQASVGAPSKYERNLGWLKEVESGRMTVRQIADREYISPGAVRKALKLAREMTSRRIR